MLPSWLSEKENYEPIKDRSIFIDRTLLNIGSTLKRFDYKNVYDTKTNPSIFLLFILITILTLSLSENSLYLYTILAFLIIRLALFNSEIISNVLSKTIKGLIVSIVILLPSLFMGYLNTFININLKVFISLTMISLFNCLYSTSQITTAFRSLKIANLFIYIIDITIKYIVLFSRTCSELLQCLKCRTIGKINRKDKAVGNIAGNLFIKSQHESKEMLEAMKCRGFNGEYPNSSSFVFSKYDFVFIVIIIMELFLFKVL